MDAAENKRVRDASPASPTVLQAKLDCFSGWLFVDRQCFPSLLPRIPNRSLCFGLERRNDRTLASDRGPYADRGHEACEVHSEEASGGPVSLAREKPGKERGGAPPLHPGAQGAEAKGT